MQKISCTHGANFPVASVMCWQLPALRLDLETSGRFPYLAAKYGGGMFLLVYLILMVTFGYVMIVSETALGRMTKKSPVGAFHKFGKSLPFHLGGWTTQSSR